jgi:hypothetical protein
MGIFLPEKTIGKPSEDGDLPRRAELRCDGIFDADGW